MPKHTPGKKVKASSGGTAEKTIRKVQGKSAKRGSHRKPKRRSK